MEVNEPSAKYLVEAGYKQTEVEKIPVDWGCSEIGAVIDLLTGFPFPSSGYSTFGTRLLRGSNVKRGETDWSEDISAFWPKVSGDIVRYLLREGDLVVAMDGSLVGRSFASLSTQDLPALLLQRVARIRSNQLSQSFLKAWVCSSRFTNHCDSVKTTTAIPHISPADIRSFKIGIPPSVAEQESIGTILIDADALIESLEQLLAKKHQIKQGAMQELLTGQRRLPGFVLPWQKRRIDKFAPLQRGFDLPSRARRQGAHPVVYSNGILNTHDQFRVRGPGVVTGRSGTIGSVTYVEHDYWPHNTALWVTRFDECDPRFVYYLFQHIGLERFSTGSGVPTLNRNDVHAFEVAVPEATAEQTAIATILSDMDTELTALEARLKKARDLKQGMAQALLTGRIRLVAPAPARAGAAA